MNLLKECRLCPRNCGINRYEKVGVCGASNKVRVSHYSLHEWEEPVISGDNGSGTIFFSYCNLRCCYCQNYEISELHKGRIVSVEEFSDICLDLQNNGANNINLVTAFAYVPHIIKAIDIARGKGLNIPIIGLVKDEKHRTNQIMNEKMKRE